MRLKFLELPSAERRLYIEQAATRRGVPPVMLEKDFWVCWVLGVLFESTFRDVLVFKGGTSLSKVFGIIDRFSEDIDLSLAPAFLGLSEEPTSRTQAGKWMKKAESACAEAVNHQIRPELERVAIEVLGKPSDDWFKFAIDAATSSPVLLFRYPTTQPAGFEYLKRSVKLEFGSLTDQQPTDRHPVRPWIAEVLGEPFSDWRCQVVALDVQRTFWEKATILHSEYHRPLDKPTPDRFSRHYADTVALANHRAASGSGRSRQPARSGRRRPREDRTRSGGRGTAQGPTARAPTAPLTHRRGAPPGPRAVPAPRAPPNSASRLDRQRGAAIQEHIRRMICGD